MVHSLKRRGPLALLLLLLLCAALGPAAPAIALNLGGTVAVDVNGSGTLDAGDQPLPGVMVTLQAGTGVSATTSTNTVGAYQFPGIAAGQYTVTVGSVPNYQNASPATVAVFLTTDRNDVHFLFRSGSPGPGPGPGPGPQPGPTSIEGFVFNDLNANDVQDSNDPPLSGVTVTLRDANGSPLASTITGFDGRFQFLNLARGTYLITETDPPGVTSINATAGSAGTVVDLNTVRIAMVEGVTTYAGTVFLDRQTGGPAPGQNVIRGSVFHDANGNGTIDVGERPLRGVLVSLRDAAGTLVATRVTINTGQYAFSGLPPGTYTVTETDPSGFVSTAAIAGTGGQVLNANTIRVTIGAGAAIYGDQLFLDRFTGTPGPGPGPILSMRLTKAVDKPAVGLGDILTYTLAFSNQGTGTVSGAVLADRIPGGTQFLDASNNGVVSGDTVVWYLPTLLPGQGGVVSFRVRTVGGPIVGAAISNQAQISVSGFGVVAVSNVVTTTVVGGSGGGVVTLGKSVDRVQASPGDVLTYTLTFSNPGPVAVGNAVIADPLAQGLNFVDAQGNVQIDVATRTLRFNLGSLAPGSTGSVSFRVSINPSVPAGATLSNQATLTGDGLPQPVASNPVATTVGGGGPGPIPGSFTGTYKRIENTFNAASITVDPQNKFTVIAVPGDRLTVGEGGQGILNADGSFNVLSSTGRVRFIGRVDPINRTATITVHRAGLAPFTVVVPRAPDFGPVPAHLVGTFAGTATNPAGDHLRVQMSIDPFGNSTFQADLNQAGTLTRRFRSGSYNITPDGRLTYGGQTDGILQPVGAQLLLTYNYTATGYSSNFQVPLVRQ